ILSRWLTKELDPGNRNCGRPWLELSLKLNLADWTYVLDNVYDPWRIRANSKRVNRLARLPRTWRTGTGPSASNQQRHPCGEPGSDSLRSTTPGSPVRPAWAWRARCCESVRRGTRCCH